MVLAAGGIAVSTPTGAVTVNVNNCTISNNSAGSAVAGTSAIGAGIMGNVTAATINVNNSTISGNTASTGLTGVGSNGGGISSIGITNITNSMITGNTASVTVAGSTASAFSGGVHVTAGTTTITGTTISGNTSTASSGTGSGFAGGLYNQQATVNISNSTISNNTASNFHAGIRTLSSTVVANTTITDSTVSGNTAVGEGGGVINISGGAANSTVNITGSTVSGNMATSPTSVGGGIENFSTSTGLAAVNLLNSTVSGNSAFNGAGVFNTGAAATINLNFSTVAANTATGTGGGLNQAATGTTNLRNSVVGDNSAPAGPDISGTITSQDYNHVENTSGGTFLAYSENRKDAKMVTTSFLLLPNDVTGIDPQIGPLGANGGTTLTHFPLIGSPLLNTIPNGTNDCGTTVTTAQNNTSRPQQTACEKGSVERALSAAAAHVSGRVLTANGQGISKATIEISGGTLTNPVFVRTGTFGYYRYEGLNAGETYVVTIHSKRFQFANPSRVVTLFDSVSDLDFIAE